MPKQPEVGQFLKKLYKLLELTLFVWLLRLRQLREDENHLSQTAYQEERRQLEKFLVDEINRKSKEQRLVFLIDTVEKLGQPEVRAEVWEYISNLCHEVTNTIRTQSKKFSFVNQLLAVVKQFENELNSDQRFKFIIFEAKLVHALKDKSTTESEVRKLEVMLAEKSSDSSHQADLCNVLGMLNAKLHLYDEALQYQQKCLSLVQAKKLSSAIPPVANLLGYLYRQLNNFNDAERYYKLGWDAAMEVDTPNKGLTQVMASIQNNLGYLYGLQKNDIKSEQCFKAAIDMWSSIETEREIANAEIASATISVNEGNYVKAKQLLEGALSRCDNEENDNRILCRAYFQLGLNQWFSAEVVNEAVWDVTQVKWDLNVLSLAQDALEKSLKLAEKYGIEEELPGILHQTASVYWHLGFQKCDRTLQEQALKLNDRSYQTSLEYNDTRYATRFSFTDSKRRCNIFEDWLIIINVSNTDTSSDRHNQYLDFS